jgi:hypothetical protein
MSFMKITITFITILFIFFSCTKSGTQNNNNNNNNGGNGNGNGGSSNGSGNITVTGILPARPYPAESITINGTGFDADKNKDTVEFGLFDASGIFRAYDEQKHFSTAKIISATTTQLVVQAIDTFVKNLDYDTYVIQNNDSRTRIRIKSNGNNLVTDPIPFRRLLNIFSILNNNDASNTNDRLRPGDSISVYGTGFNSDKCKMKVFVSGENALCAGACSNVPQLDSPFHDTYYSGCTCFAYQPVADCQAQPKFTVDSSLNAFGTQNCVISFRLKKDFFGHPTPDASFLYDRVKVKLKIVDGDGRILEMDVVSYLYPS